MQVVCDESAVPDRGRASLRVALGVDQGRLGQGRAGGRVESQVPTAVS